MWRRREGPASSAFVSSNLTARARLELTRSDRLCAGVARCSEKSTGEKNIFPTRQAYVAEWARRYSFEKYSFYAKLRYGLSRIKTIIINQFHPFLIPEAKKKSTLGIVVANGILDHALLRDYFHINRPMRAQVQGVQYWFDARRHPLGLKVPFSKRREAKCPTSKLLFLYRLLKVPLKIFFVKLDWIEPVQFILY